MGTHRTALGKTIDMAALIAKNEKTRAVSNQSVNARGDTIDSYGKIITPVTQKTGDNYAKTVKNKSAQLQKPAVNSPVEPAMVSEPKVVSDIELTNEERELNENLDEELEIEKLKANQNTK